MIPEVILDLKAKNKEEAIEELAQVLFESGKINDREGYVKDIMNREKILSTYCGSNIAIPHSVSEVVNKASFAFGRSQGLTWDEDDDLVNFVIILAIPQLKEGEDTVHIEMMSAIAELALDDDIRKLWEDATTEQDIIHTFN
ncbi:PTS sugar transporter subunit IIA [Maribacter halichondriae]|uniref:PTS sugar transporter subunit IIA n=1 Tax=Maribacter halichondriae TaxID=2980554 RepID=UPI00235899E8|nr:PTS sugar transporter subunit IIA [Maribacter sp. Hal144]